MKPASSAAADGRAAAGEAAAGEAAAGKAADGRAAAGKAAVLRAVAVLAATALGLAACAAPIKLEASVDPLGLLDPRALLYASFSGDAARELGPALLPPGQAAALAPLLARTKSALIALTGAPPTGAAPTGAADGAAARGPKSGFEAVFIGDYPFRAASLALGADGAWKREDKSFVNAKAGIRAAIPGPGLVVASSGDIAPLIERLKAPPPGPLPPRLEALNGRDFRIWAHEPFSRLFAAILGEPLGLPVEDIYLSAERKTEGGALVYEMSVAFLMANAESARLFRPALRIAWYALSRALFGQEADKAAAAAFTLDGELYWARGIGISEKSLFAALARFGGIAAPR